ncbi:MAG: family 43 glycosylhydrolase [Luteolibacter sp.]
MFQAIIVLVLNLGFWENGHAKEIHIVNDIFWYTKEGQPINSQGGGIFRFADPETGETQYYWYGVHYKEADLYRENSSVTYDTYTFQAVTCYTSKDLKNWKFAGEVLTPKELLNFTDKTWVGRLGVSYVKELKKYAMVVQYGSEVLITVSDTPAGKFTWHRKFSMKERIGTTNTGDQTVFTDEDTGKSYLVYSYGRGRNKIYVSEIGVKDGKVDLLDCVTVFQGENREGNCMFKYKGKFYMCASNLYGWDSSHAYYLVSDHIYGPYEPAGKMLVMEGCEQDYAHVTQTGFFVTIRGDKQETVVYCGDRWADFAGNGLGYNQWVPLSFEETTPYFNSLSSWHLNVRTGEWSVAADNNYIKNGSFEADRNKIPSLAKPPQDQLTGWNTEVINGNPISRNHAHSPALNYFNSEMDRKVVVGEKSLNITDTVDFERRTYQKITSSPLVELPDGIYQMHARMKNSGGFPSLSMYAKSGGKTFEMKITEENSVWKEVLLKGIEIRNGEVEVGFYAKGSAGASCQWDDVSLIKVR